MGGAGQEADYNSLRSWSFTLKRKRNGTVAGGGCGTRNIFKNFLMEGVITAHLCAGNDPVESNNSMMQE